jgi:general secretion pathway protein G
VRRAFTLVELVVVILVLGILAGIAAPKIFKTSESAIDGRIKQSLSIVRDSIELFAANNGGRLPGADGSETTFKNELAPYVRKFPVLPVEPADNDSVQVTSGGSPAGDATPTEGWKYYFDTGRFIVNSHEPTKSDASVLYDEL